MTKPNPFKACSLTLTLSFLGLFALLPFLCVLITSFLSHTDTTLIIATVTPDNYHQLINPVYFKIFMKSVWLALATTATCFVIGYPMAFLITRFSGRVQALLMLAIMIPFWTSSLIRTYAILALLKAKGLINTTLLALGLIHHPIPMLYNMTAVLIGCIYNLLPFMILPLYANIEKLDRRLIEAARDLGANRLQLFRSIILPLTAPGIFAGSLLVFLPAMTLFYIPVILGGAQSLLLGNLIENQFLSMRDWPGGSATSVALSVIMLGLILLYRRATRHTQQREALLA